MMFVEEQEPCELMALMFASEERPAARAAGLASQRTWTQIGIALASFSQDEPWAALVLRASRR